MATAEQENFIGYTPCLCVGVCVREIQEELQPEQSFRALSLASSLLSSLSPPLASFQFSPLNSLVSFHPLLALWISFPPVSLGKPSQSGAALS